jgi:hypothetical protein
VPSTAITLTPDETGLCGQRGHLVEHAGQCVLVTLVKARDRALIRPLVRRDHAAVDILDAFALDRARGALALRVGVEQRRDHHRGVVRRAPMASGR